MNDKKKILRNKARGNTVIPFMGAKKSPKAKEQAADEPKRKVSWEFPEDLLDPMVPAALHELNNKKKPAKSQKEQKPVHQVKLLSGKPAIKVSNEQIVFANLQDEYEFKIQSLFAFINDHSPEVLVSLLNIFRRYIADGVIKTKPEMEHFYSRCDQLAECIRLILEKIEYSDGFNFETKDVISELFEQGFSQKLQAEHQKKFEDYF